MHACRSEEDVCHVSSGQYALNCLFRGQISHKIAMNILNYYGLYHTTLDT